jgi:hypothetical protein
MGAGKIPRSGTELVEISVNFSARSAPLREIPPMIEPGQNPEHSDALPSERL